VNILLLLRLSLVHLVYNFFISSTPPAIDLHQPCVAAHVQHLWPPGIHRNSHLNPVGQRRRAASRPVTFGTRTSCSSFRSPAAPPPRRRLHAVSLDGFCVTLLSEVRLLMSPRITRSSARQAASQAAQASDTPPASAPTTSSAAASTPQARKRKAATDKSPANTASQTNSSGRRSKRQKIPEAPAPAALPAPTPTPAIQPRRKGKAPAPADMDNAEYVQPVSEYLRSSFLPNFFRRSSGVPGPADESQNTSQVTGSGRKSGRSKKSTSAAQGTIRRSLSPNQRTLTDEGERRRFSSDAGSETT